MIRVVVVDDHALFRQGVISGIGDTVDVVGDADDVQSGIDAIVRLQPDVVLLDVHLTSGSGAEIIVAVAETSPDVRFLALSVSDSPSDVMGLVRAGARGYITKRIDAEELLRAIEQVAAGNAVFSPRLAGFVLDAFANNVEPPVPEVEDSDEKLNRLSPREREVMQHLARGYAYKEIAAELSISARTVESHASAVLQKLQLSSRHELTHWAATRRLV